MSVFVCVSVRERDRGRPWGRGLAGDLHGLGRGLVVQPSSGAGLQQAVEVVAAAAAVHGGDAGGGGGAGAGQAGHPCRRHCQAKQRETGFSVQWRRLQCGCGDH